MKTQKTAPISKQTSMGWYVVLFLLGVATLVLVAWMFVDMMSRRCGRMKGTFFCTRDPPAPDFACAAIDWDMNQISLLGEFIPAQTVDLVKADKGMSFQFQITDGSSAKGEWTPANVVVLHKDDQVLTLHAASPKELIMDVADLYKSLNQQRAFRPKPKVTN